MTHSSTRVGFFTPLACPATPMPLHLGETVSFVATTEPKRARDFYEGTLGLRFVADDGFALLFEMPDGVGLRIQKVRKLPPQEFTVLGWDVDEIQPAVRTLKERGAEFLRIPGLGQDEDAIWTAPGGTQVAWFKDPDGNILSLAQGSRPAK